MIDESPRQGKNLSYAHIQGFTWQVGLISKQNLQVYNQVIVTAHHLHKDSDS